MIKNFRVLIYILFITKIDFYVLSLYNIRNSKLSPLYLKIELEFIFATTY